ncbi:Lsr2 family protein [Actinoplanes sp. NPDC051470]|uniref:histone-like nucleoid-structuring protein Lsr2 n=1 Tax=Actinoplanes sp. NPDC051470 TaxID=3157224 RepID=UPI0034475446
MARQVITKLIDDLDGKEADQSVEFALDGVNYTIDLSDKNAVKLRELFAPYIENGTRAGRARLHRVAISPQRGNTREQNQAIREWAKKEGHELSDRGRIPQEIVDKFNAAH